MDDFVRLFKTAKPFEGNIRFSAIVYYVDRRRDLDVALIQDCLQKAGIIKNDRQVQEIHAFRKIDKLNPRTIFTLEEIQ